MVLINAESSNKFILYLSSNQNTDQYVLEKGSRKRKDVLFLNIPFELFLAWQIKELFIN